jgi:hypothetical protein
MPAPDPNPSEAVPPYAPLRDVLDAAVAPPPWWRRWRPRHRATGSRPDPAGRLPVATRRGVFPALAALGAVLVLSLVGIAAPWQPEPSPAQGGRAPDPGRGPVMASPTPSPADPPPLTSRVETGRTSPAPPPPPPCPAPLSVAVSPDLAELVRELAGALTGGTCPQAAVTSHGPSAVTGPVAHQPPAADVWIPASSLTLRLAGGDSGSGGGADFPTGGDSLARTPVVIALPGPVADSLTGYPVWVLIYQEVTGGGIPRMSMPDHRTTVGALAQVTLQEALRRYTDGDGGRAFLTLINFRNHVASLDADVEALLDRMAGTSSARAGTEVGAFPVTEQRLVAYHRRGVGARLVPMGTYDANIEADYPLVVARSLDQRLARIADELRAALRSPAAVQRFVQAGFRPPDDRQRVSGFPAGYPNPFPGEVGYPEPIGLPDPAQWSGIVDGWTWQP